MSPSSKAAALEAALFVQAFLAAADSLQHGWFFYFSRWGGSFISFHSLAPAISLFLFFVILTQIKYPEASKNESVRFELVKSGIVSALWIWLSVEVGVWHHRYTTHVILTIVLSLAFIGIVFFSTLFVTLRGAGRTLGEAVRGERDGLLHY